MVQVVQITASQGDRGRWRVRVAYAEQEDGMLFPPVRFWRGYTGAGPAYEEPIRDVISWLQEILGDLNYGPSSHGEPDHEWVPGMAVTPAPWSWVDVEE